MTASLSRKGTHDATEYIQVDEEKHRSLAHVAKKAGGAMNRQHSIVPHKANYFFLLLEDDYLAMFEDLAEQLDPIKAKRGEKASGPSDCKAMIISALEAWMNSKRTGASSEEDLCVHLTYDEWEAALRYRYGRSTIIQCLKEMEVEGTCKDEKGHTLTGTIKRKPYIQNTYAYWLNLPVVLHLLAQLPEQSPFQQKPRPELGRPKKKRVKINGINSDGLTESSSESRVKINGINKNRLLETGNRTKINAAFYTHITHTATTTDGANAHAVAAGVSSTQNEVQSTPLPPATETHVRATLPSIRALGTGPLMRLPLTEVTTPPVLRVVPPSTSQDQNRPGAPEDAGEQHQETLFPDPPAQKPVGKGTKTATTSKGRKTTTKAEEPPKPEKAKEPTLEEQLSPEAKKVLAAWRTLFTVRVQVGPAIAKAVEDLVVPARKWCPLLHLTLPDFLKSVKDYAFENDQGGFYTKRGVKLFDLPRELPGWETVKQRELALAARAAGESTPQDEEEERRQIRAYLATKRPAGASQPREKPLPVVRIAL